MADICTTNPALDLEPADPHACAELADSSQSPEPTSSDDSDDADTEPVSEPSSDYELEQSPYEAQHDVEPLRVPVKHRAGSRPAPRLRQSRRTQERDEQFFYQISAFKQNKGERLEKHKTGAPAQPATAPRPATVKSTDQKQHLDVHRLAKLPINPRVTCENFWFGELLSVQDSIKKAVASAKHVTPLSEERCCVCLEDFADDPLDGDAIIQLGRCPTRHPFHAGCISHALHIAPRCPVCLTQYSGIIGTQPAGTMTLTRIAQPLPGEHDDTVVVDYYFPSGTQTSRDPNPGRGYHGTSRTAYFPMSRDGRKVLLKLMQAWDRRVLFTVGTSVTTGQTDCVVWNGVHHKTSMHGGPASFGYPDATYLNRVTMEMATFGIV